MLTAGEIELKAVAEAIQEHHAMVYRLAHRMLRNPADAEDVTQSVFLLLLRSHASYAKARSAKAWLARVTINQAISWVRSEKRRRQREQSWAMAANHTKGNDDMSQEIPSPESLHEAVQALPEALRVPIVLHYQEGFKYREIAEACKCPEGTVARRISIAKERIKRHLVKSGAAMTAAIGLESQLRAQASIVPPAGLAERLVEGATRELAAASQPIAATAGSAFLVKLGLALTGAVVLMTGAWYGAREALDRSQPSSLPAVAARSPGEDPPQATESTRAAGRLARAEGAAASPKPGAPGTADEPSAETAAASGEERRGPRIHGWVRDAAGQPIAGARVAFAGSPAEPIIGQSVTTDAEGRYELAWDAAVPLPQVATGGGMAAGGMAQLAADSLREAEKEWAVALQLEQAVAAERLARSQLDLFQATIEGLDAASFTASGGSTVAIDRDAVFIVQEDAAVRADAEQARYLYEVTVRKAALAELTGEARLVRKKDAFQCSSCHQDAAALAGSGTGAEKTPGAHSVPPPCAARGQEVILRAVSDAFEPSASDPIDLQETEPAQIDFVLAPARTLSGAVVTPRGEPMPGVEVAVIAYGGAQRLPPESLITRTDEDGAFAFASLPRGAYLLRAVADGCLPAEGVAETGTEGLVLRAAPAATLEATVTDREAGQPLANYRVELHDVLGVAAASTTDEAGKATLTGLTGGKYQLNTYRDGSSSQYSRATGEATVLPGQSASARLVVDGRADVTGIVRGLGEGSSSAGLVVQVVPLAGLRRASTERKAGSVAADGSFTVTNIPPGRYSLVLGRSRPDGEVEGLSVRELEVAAGQKEVSVELALEPVEPGTLDVTITDDRGQGIAGATATLEWEGAGVLAARRVVAPDANGKVELRSRPAACTLTVKAKGFEKAVVQGIAMQPGERRSIPVVLARAGEERAAAPILAASFAPEGTICLERPAGLRGLAELLRRLRIASVVLSPELEAQGVCDRVRTGGPGTRVAHNLVEKALQSAGLTWRPAGGAVIVELPY